MSTKSIWDNEEEKQIDLDAAQARLARMGMGAETARGPETLAQGGGIAAHTLTGTQFASVGKPVSTPRPDDAFRAAQEGKPAKKRRSDAGVPRKPKVAPAEQPSQAAGGLGEDEYDTILRLDEIRSKLRQEAEEMDRSAKAIWKEFNKAEADYFNYLGSLKKP